MTYYLESERSLHHDVLVVRVEGNPDPDLLESLKTEERRHQLKNPGNSKKNLFHISAKSANTLLKAMAASGQLKHGNKNIVCDFYGKNTLTFLIDDGLIIGQVQTRNSLIDISDSPFIGRGSPHCFLDGITLRFLTTDLPWKTLKKLYTQTPPPTIEEVEACVIENDPDTPNIEYVSGNASEPLPLLKLKDASGAFAELWLDDGTCGRGSEWEKDLLETGFTRRLDEGVAKIHSSGKSMILGPITRSGCSEPFCSDGGLPNRAGEEEQMEGGIKGRFYTAKNFATPSYLYFCPLDQVQSSLSFLLELGWTIQDCEGRNIKLAGKLNLDVQQSTDSIIIKGSIPYGDEEANIASIAGQTALFVPLSKNTVGLIPLSNEIKNLAREGELVAEGIKIRKTQAMSFEPLLKPFGLNLFQPHQPVKIGSRFHGTLRPYQQAGVEWLSFLKQNGFHGILADDMGLGKTVQILAYLTTETGGKPSLCVMPTSLLYNWKKEAETFFPELLVTLHHGPERSKKTLPKEGLILTSYGTLLRDKDLFKASAFQCIFLDEAQVIKNRRTQQFQAACELEAVFRCCITGTPVENRTEELFTHFHFLMPDLLKGCDPKETSRIKKKTGPFILRRRKEEVASDLPEKIEQNVWISMPENQRTAYDQFAASAQQSLIQKVKLDGAGKHRMEIFETLLRLRQICCHPYLVNGQEGTSGKLEALIADMETIKEEGKKALIFSQFTSMLSIIKKSCSKEGWKFCYLDGQTKERKEQVDHFQTDPEIPFFLISLKAGGVGLNLTAADYVLLFDPWWNPAVERQAIDRAHRIGRKDTVIAKRYLCLDSIEEKMLHLNTAKQHLADQLLDETSDHQILTEDDFLFLLESTQ
ncbi:uncharacterized ATP-dependent helicase ywqA [Waddlia chondrophila 2032/99]|uniref:Uncharacterized ATP-dependent helicase ywqA n=1 Tax=Waddlia chondrophila 2032/99 TaxID=765953 RepID=F8LEL3_9BACT|nr:uncharacterized ATP-dependent helicase ywqA [Waddlia chondrophila 2032/99]